MLMALGLVIMNEKTTLWRVWSLLVRNLRLGLALNPLAADGRWDWII